VGVRLGIRATQNNRSQDEILGDVTPQPTPPKGTLPNRFLALAVFDRPEKGGNGDGVIDSRDAVFSDLRIWRDLNHSGVSEPDELSTSESAGVTKIDLDYKVSERTDQYGNQYRYRAKVYGDHGSDLGRWAWDVIFKFDQTDASTCWQP
jgi:hypothetical protein